MVSYKYPQNNDLRRLVRFSSEDGLIWLAQYCPGKRAADVDKSLNRWH